MAPLRRFGDEAVLLVVALASRALYFIIHARSIYFDHPILDSLWIHQWAVSLATGEATGGDAYFRAPLYPYLVALLYRGFGPHPWVIGAFQHVLGSIMVVLVYRLGRRVADRSTGLIAALLFCFYWVAVFFEGELLIVTVASFLGLVFLLALIRGSDMPGGRARWAWLVVTGGLLGLAAIARPNFLVLIPLAAAWPWVHRRWMVGRVAGPVRRRPGAAGRTTAPAGRDAGVRWLRDEAVPVCLGLAVAILPVTIRNVAVGQDLVLISSQGGLNFYIGNGPGADGKTAIAPAFVGPMRRTQFESDYRDNITIAGRAVAEEAVGRRLKESEISRFWLDRALDGIRADPGAAVKRMFRKTTYLVNAFEISDNKDLQEVERDGPWIFFFPVRLSIILPLAWGGFLVFVLRFRNALPVVIYMFLYCFSVTLFFVNTRMRLPVAPIVMLLAALALTTLWRGVAAAHRPRRARVEPPGSRPAGFGGDPGRRELLAVVAAICVGVPLANARVFDVDERTGRPGFLVNRAVLLIERGDCQGAQRAYQEALRADPGLLEAHYGQARAFERCGDLVAAASAYEDVVSRWPEFVHGYLGKGRIAERSGDLAAAAAAYRRAVELDPDLVDALLAYGVVLQRMGWHGEARTALERAISLAPRRLSLWMNYGYTLSALGMEAEAIEAWQRALELEPGTEAAALARRNIAEARERLGTGTR